MFTDKISLFLKAGKGGDGLCSFQREKFKPKGGPSGGNGGKGGSIFIKVDTNLISLENLRSKKLLKSEKGKSGGPQNQKGKNGENLILKVPLGTIVKDNKTKKVLFDLSKEEDIFTICEGGIGGRGNVSFKSSTHQTPYIATKGKPGEEKDIDLELKIIADVGLIGFPNAGKSTLISNITNAKVKIAKYPFTTLNPNIGVLQFDDFSKIFIADIPGIIEGAHQNKGLGISFLKHIERTKILIFIIDISQNPQKAIKDFETLKNEILLYKKEILKKPFLIALNKIDLNIKENIKIFKEAYPIYKKSIIEISALTKENLNLLLKTLKQFFRKS